MKQALINFAIFIHLTFCFACSKEEFLNKKPSSSLVIPTSLNDFSGLLDNQLMNVSGILATMSAGDYYLASRQIWESIGVATERNAYILADDLYQGEEIIEDWDYPYKQMLYANIVLEGLLKIVVTDENRNEYNRIKGHALFVRGHALFNLSQHFAKVYDVTTAKTDPGVPIRLESDVTVGSTRASLQKTYDQLLKDLTEAESLLPFKAPGTDRTRPYKNAAQGLLARVYLSMRNYDLALKYAESSLNLYSTLMTYATLSTTSISPISVLNSETIFFCNQSANNSRMLATYRFAPNSLVTDELYTMYNDNDLRKIIFFTISAIHKKPVFRGTYDGTSRVFSGLATDELFLIKAECQVRLDNFQDGLRTLNALLVTRWKKNTFIDLTASHKDDALAIVLRERRKELPLRGLRWQDLRRLNKEGANITLTRILGSDTLRIAPNSPKYILPIPANEIRINGLEQNAR